MNDLSLLSEEIEEKLSALDSPIEEFHQSTALKTPPPIYITALHLRHGGVELAITLQANALVARGFRVCLLVVYNLGEPAYPLDERVEVVYLTKCRPNREAFWKAVHSKNPFAILKEGIRAGWTLWQKKAQLKKAIARVRTGVIVSTRHEHSLILSRHGHRQVHKVAQLHHDHRFDQKLIHEITHGYQNIDDFALLLPSLKDEMETLLRPLNRWTRLHAIGNFLPERVWQDKETALPFEQRKAHFLWVGRLADEKNPLEALAIFASFRHKAGKEGADYQLHFYGDGPLRPALEEKVEELGLREVVFWHGMCSHEVILTHMREARALLLTSDTEGLAFVMLEAFASALPIFAYDVRVAPHDLLQHDHTGFLLPKGDREAYATKLAEFIRDTDLYAYVVAGGYQVLQKYSEKTVLKQWTDIYLRQQEPQETVLPMLTLLRKTCRYPYDVFVRTVANRIQAGAKATLIITINPEMLSLARRQPRFYEVFFRPHVYLVPDGLGVVKTAQKLGLLIKERVPGVELCASFLALANEHAWSVFLYGGKPEVMEALVQRIKTEYPRVRITGAWHGYGQNEEELIRQVVQESPDLVLAALGCPRQEFFLANCQTEMSRGILMGVGGSFDVLSGSKKRAPQLWQRLGLEWAYRLLCEPARIPRFLRGNLPYLYYVWSESRQLRRSWRVEEVPLTAQAERTYLFEEDGDYIEDESPLQRQVKDFLAKQKPQLEDEDV